MSKTFMYLIVTIVTYLLIVKGLGVIETTDEDNDETDKTDSKKNDTKNGTGLNDNEDENGVSKGTAGQVSYRMGYTN